MSWQQRSIFRAEKKATIFCVQRWANLCLWWSLPSCISPGYFHYTQNGAVRVKGPLSEHLRVFHRRHSFPISHAVTQQYTCLDINKCMYIQKQMIFSAYLVYKKYIFKKKRRYIRLPIDSSHLEYSMCHSI